MEHFKLLIIGAGASGIAAASRLLEKGFSDFRVIEAENRIGGRIYTTFLGSGSDKSVELGAEWIHGEKDNIVFELASKFDLADNSPPSIVFTHTSFFDFSGHQVNKDISVALTETYQDIINTEEKNFDNEVLKGSLGHYFEVEFQKRVNELRNKLNISDDLQEKFVKVFENFENSIDASNSWYETSLSGHLEYWECDGNSLTTWKDKCYNMIFDILTKKIADPDKQLPVDDKILFNKEVIKVNWNAECNSKKANVLECSDGTGYSADHILVTCSLGVLKERAENMFVPPLPKQKLKCIQNLGFGTVDKIFVKFSHRWWEKDSSGFGFLWSKEERKNDFSGWLNGIICFHPIDPDSLIMRGWVTGEAAQQMESLPHKEIVDGIKFLFDKFLGSAYKIPAPEIVSTSRWYSNPYFRGSYSCRLLVSESANVWASQLAQPVCDIKGKPVLLFGGEATHDHYYSTVHGAIEAGYREAERLLPFLMENFKKNFQVVIVGAGISGLSAATTLIENGLTDIVILEAQSEPGGRIRSLQIGDYCLELGAQWIHGDKNEVFTICKENDLLTEEYSSEGEGLYLRENGEKIDEDIVREVDDIIKDILENCENYVGYQSEKEIPHSIGQELLLKFNQYLEGCSKDTEEIKKIKRELFGWHIRYQLIDNSCSDLYNLSAKAWGLFKFCGGNDYVNFKKGYSSLIDTLVNRLPQNTISYETSVERVEWMEKINHGSNYCAKIKCNNGITYFSQFVIVTSSLGYLKKNYKKMFYPPLPVYLTKAIEFLDFGVIDKIFLIYDKPWWDSKVRGFQLVWSEEESTEKHWSRYVTGFDVILKNKPILLGWVGGEGAKVVEQMSEDEVGREATELLRSFTKKREIPLPNQVIRTKWWCNKYVRGAYSHITIKCDESDISGSNLAQPVYSVVERTNEDFKKPTIFFAGESTHKNHFSTVHGAYESGQNQAKVILDYVLKHRN